MTKNDREKSMFERLRETLDNRAETIDPAIQFKLTQIRKRALKGDSHNRYLRWPFWRIPAVGLAAAGFLLFFLLYRQPDLPNQPVYSGLEDVEILATNEAPEFYSELDFYIWLAVEVEQSG